MGIMSLKRMYERSWGLMHATPSQNLTPNIVADIDDYLGADQKLIDVTGLAANRIEDAEQKIYLVRCNSIAPGFMDTGCVTRTLDDVGFDREYIFTKLGDDMSVQDAIDLFDDIVTVLVNTSTFDIDYDVRRHAVISWLIWKMSQEPICAAQGSKYDLYDSGIHQRVYEDFRYQLQYINHFVYDMEKYPNVTGCPMNSSVVSMILADVRNWEDPSTAQVSGCYARFQRRWENSN